MNNVKRHGTEKTMLNQAPYRIITLVALVILACLPVSAQRMQFYPSVDSIFIVGSCVPPSIMFVLHNNLADRDTVSLVAPYNAPICTGFPPTPENHLAACYFTVQDSLDQYQYAMSLRYESYPWNDIPRIGVDTVFYVPPGSFTITLYVLLNDSLIDSLGVRFHSIQTGLYVEESTGGIVPARCTLHQNYPNPFNGETCIAYVLVRPADVRLDVYNQNGQRIAVLAEGDQSPGNHTVVWRTHGLASATYIVVLSSASERTAIKCILLK